MDWESYIGKKVKIVKTDGFVKYGSLISCDDTFITLLFDDGSERRTSLNKNTVSEIVEVADW